MTSPFSTTRAQHKTRLAEIDAPEKALGNLCKTHAILHSRGKSNEQFAKGFRPPTEEDAEFAVHAVGSLLREVDWALSPF